MNWSMAHRLTRERRFPSIPCIPHGSECDDSLLLVRAAPIQCSCVLFWAHSIFRLGTCFVGTRLKGEPKILRSSAVRRPIIRDKSSYLRWTLRLLVSLPSMIHTYIYIYILYTMRYGVVVCAEGMKGSISSRGTFLILSRIPSQGNNGSGFRRVVERMARINPCSFHIQELVDRHDPSCCLFNP